jgi:hypothetical protein
MQFWHSHIATSVFEFVGLLIASVLIGLVKAMWLSMYARALHFVVEVRVMSSP